MNMFMEKVKNNGLELESVPMEQRTKELCTEAIINDARAFKFVPEKYITAKYVVEVAKMSSIGIISYLPKPFKNNNFYLELVELYPDMIWALPQNSLTAKICKSAIKAFGYKSTAEAIIDNPRLLSRMHTSLYDHDTCRAFVNSEFFKNSQEKGTYGFNCGAGENNGRLYLNNNYYENYYLPSLMRWEDTIIPLLQMDGTYIQNVDEAVMTEKICEIAIDESSLAFEYIPEGLRNERLSRKAFAKDHSLIRDIPEQYITEEMVREAVMEAGWNLKYIPISFKTKEICMIAVHGEYQAGLKDVPVAVLDKDIIMAFFSAKPQYHYFAIKEIPINMLDYEICLAAVRYDNNNFIYVPKQFISYEMCYLAVEESPYSLKEVPREYMTEELLLKAIEERDNAFSYIPKDLLTEKICLQAILVGSTHTIIGEIPEDMVTEEMVNKVTEKKFRSLKGIPERFITEEMLIQVAQNSPEYLRENFPDRFRTQAFLNRMREECKDYDIEWTLEYNHIKPL